MNGDQNEHGNEDRIEHKIRNTHAHMGTGTGTSTGTRTGSSTRYAIYTHTWGRGRERGRIGEGGREAKKRKKPHNSCRRDQALSFCTRHHLCRQGVALAGIRQLRSQGPVSAHAHRNEGINRRGRRRDVGNGKERTGSGTG